MKVSDFLKQRNIQILERYRELRQQKIQGALAKKMISREFGNLAIPTIEQIIYNKKYSNSPYKKP